MDYKKLGTSDLMVSPVCVGCMSFGERFADFHEWTLNQQETTEVVKHALDLGINFFDTANCYAHGTSEEFLGKALKASGVARDKVVIATKVYFNEGCLSKAAIEREIDGSLKRLGMDYVDLYIIHRYDYNTPIEETMEALSGLVDKGKVRALGASAMYGYQLMKMQQVAKDNGWHQFASMQNHYNLLYREDERELIPVCHEWAWRWHHTVRWQQAICAGRSGTAALSAARRTEWRVKNMTAPRLLTCRLLSVWQFWQRSTA